MVGIYKITSPTGKIYIGQSYNIKARFSSYKGGHCKTQKALYNSFLKYGIDNHVFEVILELDENSTQEILDHYEIFYINFYKSENYILLNIKDGGSHGKLSKETKNKISISCKARGRKCSEEAKEKLRNLYIGKKRSEEDILKMKMGNKNKLQKSNFKGKHHSEETKEKLRIINIGRTHSEETKEKMRKPKLSKT